MRRKMFRLVLSLVLLGAGLLLGAGSAAAGGPTSAIVVSPEQQRATALYYSDDDYSTLMTLLGDNPTGQATGHPSGDQSGGYVTVTWLIHDVSVWRSDQIYYENTGAPWILTQQSDSVQPFTGEGVWHRATGGRALIALLNRLVLDAPSTPAAGSTAAPSTTPAAASTTAAASTAATAGSTPTAGAAAAAAPSGRSRQLRPVAMSAPIVGSAAVPAAGWPWGLAGLLVGIALALLAMITVTQWRHRRADDDYNPLRPPVPVIMLGEDR